MPEAHLLHQLVELDVGEDAAGDADRLTVSSRDLLFDQREDVALEDVLDRRGEVRVGPIPEASLAGLPELADRLLERMVALRRAVLRVQHEEVRPPTTGRPELRQKRIHRCDQAGIRSAMGCEARHLAGVAVRMEAEHRRHVFVVVTEWGLRVEERRTRLEPALRAAEEAHAVGVPDTVDCHHLGFVETGLVVGAGGVARVMIDELAVDPREELLLVGAGLAERDVAELPKALRVNVLEAAVAEVPQSNLGLARETLLQGEAAVDGFGAAQVEALGHEIRREARPAALHLDAAEAFLGGGEERAAVSVEERDAGLVTAMEPENHNRPHIAESPPGWQRRSSTDAVSPGRAQFQRASQIQLSLV